MMYLSRRSESISKTYSWKGSILETVSDMKYMKSLLGVTITNNFKWNKHTGNISAETNKMLGLRRRNLSNFKGRLKKLHTRDIYGLYILQ